MIIGRGIVSRRAHTFIPRRFLANTRGMFPISSGRDPLIKGASSTNLLIPERLNSSTSTPNDSQTLTFEGNTTLVGTPEERMMNVFGGRIKGDVRQSSSRREIGQPRMIAGVLVPHKPTEPDNCCMSGCVNCVWEQFNDDLKDWRRLRNEAAQKLNKTDNIWPTDFNPPLATLEMKNVPQELRKTKLKLTNKKKISSSAYFPTKAKPGAQHARRVVPELNQDLEDKDDWENVPVSFRVFAETEKKMKAKQLERKRRREEEERKAKEANQQGDFSLQQENLQV